jgi:hypothetical protein
VTQPIRPVDWREPSVTAPDAVDAVPRVRLLTPAEREAARRRREALRRAKEKENPSPQGRPGTVDHFG